MAELRRRSSVAALLDTSAPLLKFVDEKAVLDPAGLEMLRKTKGLIYPVILMGDGRAGKSYLASRILNLEEVFVTSDSAEPVTEGIDAVIQNMDMVLRRGKEARGEAVEEEEEGKKKEPMNILVLDCEGGNNAMAAIRTLVNVFGIVIGTEVLFVAGGSFSEAAIQNLGASLASRSLIKTEGGTLQEPKLIFVVNKNTLRYGDDTLERSLTTEQKDPGRQGNRVLIRETFPVRKFFAIPLMGMPNFEDEVTKLRETVLGDVRPIKMGSQAMRGEQLCGLLEFIVEQMETMQEVSLPSMARYVIYDGFLKPLLDDIADRAQHRIPELTDYDRNLDSQDPRPEAMVEFERESAHLAEKEFVTEARETLEEKLKAAWLSVWQINEAMGDQTKDTQTETREIPGASKFVPIGGRGLLAKVKLEQMSVKIETRQVIEKKNGKTEVAKWIDTGMPVMKIVETAFQHFNVLPTLLGKLQKRSPNWFQTVMSGFSGNWQERNCVIKEGHFIWWDAEKIKKQDLEVSGSINFLVNRAEVVEDTTNEFTFIIRPATSHGRWADPTSFSGGANRELIFSCEQGEKSRDQWISAIKKNIEFADLAFKQLGEKKVKQEVGSKTPTLAQATWGAK